MQTGHRESRVRGALSPTLRGEPGERTRNSRKCKGSSIPLIGGTLLWGLNLQQESRVRVEAEMTDGPNLIDS